MNRILQTWGHLIVRVFLSALFLFTGVQLVLNFSDRVGFIETIVPFAALVAVVVAAMKLLGGLSVLLGYKTEWGAWTLIVFVALTIVFVHNNMGELVTALKNLGLIGGLLLLIMYGAGPKSLDAKSSVSAVAPEPEPEQRM